MGILYFCFTFFYVIGAVFGFLVSSSYYSATEEDRDKAIFKSAMCTAFWPIPTLCCIPVVIWFLFKRAGAFLCIFFRGMKKTLWKKEFLLLLAYFGAFCMLVGACYLLSLVWR